jgi:hypothetical protein
MWLNTMRERARLGEERRIGKEERVSERRGNEGEKTEGEK